MANSLQQSALDTNIQQMRLFLTQPPLKWEATIRFFFGTEAEDDGYRTNRGGGRSIARTGQAISGRAEEEQSQSQRERRGKNSRRIIFPEHLCHINACSLLVFICFSPLLHSIYVNTSSASSSSFVFSLSMDIAHLVHRSRAGCSLSPSPSRFAVFSANWVNAWSKCHVSFSFSFSLTCCLSSNQVEGER